MIRVPVTVEQMGNVMNILPFQTVGDVFRSINEQIDTGKENTRPVTGIPSLFLTSFRAYVAQTSYAGSAICAART